MWFFGNMFEGSDPVTRVLVGVYEWCLLATIAINLPFFLGTVWDPQYSPSLAATRFAFRSLLLVGATMVLTLIWWASFNLARKFCPCLVRGLDKV